MKYCFMFFLAVLLSACSGVQRNQIYEVKMLSGETLYAQSKPVLRDDGFYHFSDVNKQSYIIKNNFVLYVEPVSLKN